MKDATFYNFNPEAQEYAEHFMGWVDLASNPPYPYKKIKQFANAAQAESLDTVMFIDQGGTTRTPTAIAKYNKFDCQKPNFKVLDSVSPVIE